MAECLVVGFRGRVLPLAIEVSTIVAPLAHLAAVLSQHGVVSLYVHYRDFRKFCAPGCEGYPGLTLAA